MPIRTSTYAYVSRLHISAKIFTYLHSSRHFLFLFSANTALSLFEEIKPNMLEKIENLEQSLELELELMDGDILVFQKQLIEDNDYRWETSIELKVPWVPAPNLKKP